ncbi:MAG TPA: MBL fold metallo-hydrolase [Alphaproteobacteria bacterium]|jgi:phosphoribosyl 1,2-cyclic phosphodiesterase|nr:MBL fold metallo-hydrolase [Alphaproteobacteria bacterium]HAM46928.1 MBL fold metallo-hydrolase [Alphaproteobacteria bacterium]HBA42126.1 MBL fold metallo-hydrolase [Alphaproteobacteria bacterium]HBC53079.1 MBL fold metallo-hydrolase [Alphaproteobacteria bacterium]HCO91957.1 MBL fold metallo-hydrolase [Alphaproteobacteria bacterium]
MAFKVKFWGVRGSIACPGANHIQYGGNTSCIEVSCGGERLILDAGTGMRNLGHWLLRKNTKHATILMSHTHWDHISGFPFFAPAFHEGYSFDVMAGHLGNGLSIKDVFSGQMTHPFFPVPLEVMNAEMNYHDFKAGDSIDLSSRIHIKTAPLNHPDGATGYRIEHRGHSVCYVTDTEHVIGKPDENILALIEGADLVIYDSTYTDKEFESKIGWGHSTWQEGIRLCKAANVKSLAIFHHDPDHEDRFLNQLEAEAKTVWSAAFLARENARLNIA